MIRKADVTAAPARILIDWFVGVVGRNVCGVQKNNSYWFQGLWL